MHPMKPKYLVSANFYVSEKDSLQVMTELGKTFPGLRAFVDHTQEALNVICESLQRRDGYKHLQDWLDDHTEDKAAVVITDDPTKDESGGRRFVPVLKLNIESYHHLRIHGQEQSMRRGSAPFTLDWHLECDIRPIGMKRASGIVNLLTTWFEQPISEGATLKKVPQVGGPPFISTFGFPCGYSMSITGEPELVILSDQEIRPEDLTERQLTDMIRAYFWFWAKSMASLEKAISRGVPFPPELEWKVDCQPKLINALTRLTANHYLGKIDDVTHRVEVAKLAQSYLGLDQYRSLIEPGSPADALGQKLFGRLYLEPEESLFGICPAKEELYRWCDRLLEMSHQYRTSYKKLLTDPNRDIQFYWRFLGSKDAFREWTQYGIRFIFCMTKLHLARTLQDIQIHPENYDLHKSVVPRITDMLNGYEKGNPHVLEVVANNWFDAEYARIYGD